VTWQEAQQSRIGRRDEANEQDPGTQRAGDVFVNDWSSLDDECCSI